MTTTSEVTITINGNTITADISTIQQLVNGIAAVSTVTTTSKQAKQPKHEVKDTADLAPAKKAQITKAVNKLAKEHFKCHAQVEGDWVWVYADDHADQLTSRWAECGKRVLGKGWKYVRCANKRDENPHKGAFVNRTLLAK